MAERARQQAAVSDSSLGDALLESLAPQEDAPVEWWYYHGHLCDGDDRFSFHVAFFRVRASGFRIGSLIPARWLCRNFGFGHVSLTDHCQRRTWFSHRRALDEKFKREMSAAPAELGIGLSDLTLTADRTHHRLDVVADACRVQLSLSPSKPVVCYPPSSALEVDLNRVSRHFSCPRMAVQGSIDFKGSQRFVQGTAWMDREFGQVGPDSTVKGWTWIAIQLDDGRELVIYQKRRQASGRLMMKAAIVALDGELVLLDDQAVNLSVLREFPSRLTDACYPVSFAIAIVEPATGARWELIVDADQDDCEMDTRGTTHTIYWEGSASVRGTANGVSVQGRAFMELLGFERRLLWGQMNHARQNLPVVGYVANEIRHCLGRSANQFRIHR